MTSVQELYDNIKKIDIEGSPFGKGNATYELTYNDILGLPKSDLDDGNFTVLSPFPAIPKDNTDHKPPGLTKEAGKMPIQQTFKAVLRKGIEMSKGQDKLFIDIADLDKLGPGFFAEGHQNSVAQTIANELNNLSAQGSTVTPIIRFLRGVSGDETIDAKFWTKKESDLQNIFWPEDKDKKRDPLVKNAKAELHIGYYSPSFRFKKEDEDKIRQTFSLWAQLLYKERSKELLDSFLGGIDFALSWNHGKILAVGGKVMMTGGINYWEDYTSTKTDIIDMQAKVTGDAAITAHKYADYFWKYLNTIHETDLRSFKRSIALNTPTGQVSTAWKTDTAVPIFEDTVKPTLKTNGIRVLTVARLGDWHGKLVPEYPVQFVDGIRDVMLNYLGWALLVANKQELFFEQILSLSDTAVGSETQGFVAALRDMGYSPAAWASRSVKLDAISNAKKSVYMSNQMIADWLQTTNAKWNEMVLNVNSKITKDQAWDGFLWPYDLLFRLALLIVGWAEEKASDIAGIQIVLSGKNSEWGDRRTIGDLYEKVVQVLQAMHKWKLWKEAKSKGNDTSTNSEQSKELDEMQAEAEKKKQAEEKKVLEEVVKKYMHVKRIGSHFGENDSIHTKTVCVDERLLYIGSDNLYPSYNEEHGIWVDDETAVSNWVNNYWKELWPKAADPTAKDLELSPAGP